MYLAQGGVPGPGGGTWSQGGYLAWEEGGVPGHGGVPGLGGCTWSWGGTPGPGGCLVWGGAWSGGVPGLGGVPGQVLPPRTE